MPAKANPKAVAAMAKKAAAQEVRDEAAADEKAGQVAEDWKVGSNRKKAANDDAAADKERERMRREAEKAALQAEEDGANGAIKVGKVKKVRKKDDLGALLTEGLAKAPKSKVEKEAAAKKKAKAAAAKKQAEDEASAKAKPLDPLAPAPLVPNLNKESFFADEYEEGRDEIAASGLDAALDALEIGGVGLGGGGEKGGVSGKAPGRKAAYLAFEERVMPQVRGDYPGLRLAQYRDKTLKLWSKSPENPANSEPSGGAP